MTKEQKEKLIAIIKESVPDFSQETFDAIEPLLSSTLVRKALIRNLYFQYRRNTADDKVSYNHNEAVRMCSSDVGYTESHVNKIIYNCRIGGIWD